MTTRRRFWTIALLLVLFLATFIPRAVYPVSRPLQWYERSFRFIDAVFHGQWADTVVSEHPGVTPMVLIGSAQHAYYALLKALGTSPPHPLDIAGRAFRAEVAVSILPLALAIALGVLVIWWLLRELFGEAVAWAGAGLLALDPFHIAISKVVHVDALLSVLMILSALTLLLHLRREIPHSVRNDNGQGRYRWLLASGVLAGLAFLTKSPAYFLVPFLGLSLLVAWAGGHGHSFNPQSAIRNPQSAIRVEGLRRLVRDCLVPVLLWMGAAAATYVVLWPAMWVQPGQTLATVFAGVLKHTGRAHPQPLYFLGELTTEDPGPGFYALTLLVKTTLLSLPLFVAGLAAPLSARWRGERRLLGLVIAYFVFFFVQMSLGAKKDPRYLLPAFPALDIIAGVGLVTLAKGLTGLPGVLTRNLSGLRNYLVVAVLAVQAALVWPYHPYYITYASPLVGGPAGAQRLLVATPESEGLDLVAGYLNRMYSRMYSSASSASSALPEADRLRVGVQMPAREAFRQYFVGEIADTREAGLDYLVFAEVYVRRHVAEDQWGEQWETYKYRRPAYTAYLHGLPYAWVYRVDAEPQEPAVSKPVCLGEQIRLLGYTLVVDGEPLDRQVVHPGEALRLMLHWATSGTPAGDYNVFVHLLGPDGTLVTQQDNSPVRGTQPTWGWEAGLRLDDPYELVVPPDAAAGPYTLVAGMYDWRTGERLVARMYSSALTCAVPLPDNRVPLATFEVRPERVPWWEVAAWILAGALAIAGLIAARPTFPKVGPNAMNWVHNNFREGAGGWWDRWGMVLAYVLLTLGMTYPLLFRLGSHYVGTGGDLLIFPWNDWWSRKCLLEGRNPFFTTWLFYPRGVSLVYHNFAWLNTALWLPLSPLVGSIAATNLIFLFNLALGGIGMYLLVHYMTGEPRAAFVAGLIFAFWPCRMSHYNHPNMISIGWIPLFLLFLMRTIREKPKRMYSSASSALLGGLFLALTGLARWLHLLFTGGLALLYLAYSVLRERQYWNRRTVAALVLMAGLATLVMLPLLSPLVLAQLKGGEKAEDVFSTDPEITSTDLLSYFVPDRSHPLFRPWLADLWSRMRRGAYLGYGALALVGLGLWRGRRDRGLWLVVGVGLFVLSLGPNLQVAGRQFDVTLPYAWVQDWPVVQVLRHPNRFSVYLSLPVAVLAGYGMAWLAGPAAVSRACPEADRRSHCRRARRAWLWTVCVGALVLFEYLPWPYPTVQPSVPPFYHQLAQEPGEFAILDLPMGARTVAKPYMYYATIHGKPLVEGHVSRLPVSAYDFIDSIPLLRGLHQDNEMDPALGDVSRQLSALAQANVRYVVLHPDLVPPEQMARWQDWLGVAPAFADQQTVVYRTQPQYGQDFEFVGELGDGIGVVRATLLSSSLAYDRVLEARLVWGTRSAPGRDWLARLTLVSPAGEEVQWMDFEPCAGWPASQWGANGVARGSGALHLNLPDEGGTYTVTVQLVDPVTGARAGQPFPVGRVEVQAAD